MFYVGLYIVVVEFVVYQFFSVKDCIVGVYGYLVFSCIFYQFFCVCEGDVVGCCFVFLVVGDDFYFFMLKYIDIGKCCFQVDVDGWSFICYVCL